MMAVARKRRGGLVFIGSISCPGYGTASGRVLSRRHKDPNDKHKRNIIKGKERSVDRGLRPPGMRANRTVGMRVGGAKLLTNRAGQAINTELSRSKRVVSAVIPKETFISGQATA
jgi:hypothetical protein